MSYVICKLCQARYGFVANRPHVCGKPPRRSAKPSKCPEWKVPTLVDIGCHWTACTRVVRLAKVRGMYRLEYEWGGGLVNHPICLYHRQLLRDTFGMHYKMNGIKYALRELDERYSGGPLTRLVILDLAGHTCEGCKQPLTYSGWPEEWIVDHRIPTMDGGANTMRNVRPLCAACDKVKTSSEQANAMRIIGLSNAGRTLTEEHRSKIGAASQRYWDNVPQAEKLAHGRKSVEARKK